MKHDIVKQLEQLIGTPYLNWDGQPWGKLKNSGPFHISDDLDLNQINSQGCNCAGLVNIMFRLSNIPIPGINSDYPGGVYAYQIELPWKPFDDSKSYPKFSLLMTPYIDIFDQGHLAIIWSDGAKKCLHNNLLH